MLRPDVAINEAPIVLDRKGIVADLDVNGISLRTKIHAASRDARPKRRCTMVILRLTEQDAASERSTESLPPATLPRRAIREQHPFHRHSGGAADITFTLLQPYD